MATWTNIANTSLEPGSPARSVDAFALRDNPIAIAEGAAGAPRIAGQQGPAVQTEGLFNGAVTSAKLATGSGERDWVLERTAGASRGAVGTYAFCVQVSGGIPSAGGTVAGSSLRYTHANNFNGSGTPPGSWRVMGWTASTGLDGRTVYLRIS